MWALDQLVDLVGTAEVGSAVDIVDDSIVAVGLSSTGGVLSTTSWNSVLARTSCGVDVLSVGASGQSLESIVTGEV